MYRSDLERLMTLTAAEVDAAHRGERLEQTITRCLDEDLELSELAEDAWAQGHHDLHAYYAQEAAAWRATARTLRAMSADSSGRRRTDAA